MPLKALSAHSRPLSRAALAGLAILCFATAGSANVRPSRAIATPFEVGMSPAGNYLAALSAASQRDTLAAATYFREVLRFDPRNPALIERAFIASVANGDIPQSMTLAERLVRIDPKNGLANLALGVRAIKTRQFTAARNYLAKGGGFRQGEITSILLSAWAYAGAGEYGKALETADKLADRRLALFRDYHAGLIADLGKRPQEAARRMKAAYDAESGTLRLVDAYARIESKQGRNDEALRAYRAFDEQLPRHPVIVQAMQQIAAGKPLDSVVANATDGAAEVLYGLASAGGGQGGDELAAIIYLRLALWLEPNHALAIISLGDAYERIKQDERAIDVFESMPANSPLRPSADLQVAFVLDKLDRKDEALDHLNSIVKDQPNDPDALIALANLQRTRKQFSEAAQSYTRALASSAERGKADWTIYYYRAVSYERSKQWPLAEADFRRALEVVPDNPVVLNYLGYSWVDQGTNLDEAFRMLKRAVELRPRDGYIVDSLGWAYYRLGKYDDAVRELERAIELKPSDPVINDHLGDAYWKVDRKLEAQFQWNHARDLNPEPEELPKILRKIDKGMDAETATPVITPAVTPAIGSEKPKMDGG
ncbi:MULTISPECIES: tetratricopeptide repeat protein [unclassified Beijerinckia]|uniref:tetratricopeptide repeat protein n=1 Tax=unclassified Beijerinckia TaxID=2638183 RepID=UPI000897FEAE|nr:MULTISPECIES: tetratricopeptide repeat protein [unclassified Beijerinckia]MDH7797033.1 tetratricopeptide (TPR) repeat protein [Beijerinckia sp. GAS462]SEC69467.1 Tetratricopeptide repeat-containing protein [Beijerinckia sp. 28-YEA-48]